MSSGETFGVVGCGRMGERRARSIAEHDDAELVVVSDVDEARAAELGSSLGCGSSSDVEGTLDREDVSNVVISTPNKFHRDHACLAAAAGSNVFCEKPLARSPAEAREMVEVANRNDVSLKVSSNLRYFPSVQKAKSLVDEGAIGDVNFVRGWIGNDGWHLDKETFEDEEMIGGGTLIDNGVHLLDLYRWFVGEVEACSGFVDSVQHEVPMEDVALGAFQFADGAYGLLQSSWAEWDEYMYMEVIGTDGYVRVDNRLPNSTVTLGDREGYQETFEYTKLPPSSYENEIDDYIQRVRGDEDPLPTGFDGLRAVEMAHGIYTASETRRTCELWSDEDEALLDDVHTETSAANSSSVGES